MKKTGIILIAALTLFLFAAIGCGGKGNDGGAGDSMSPVSGSPADQLIAHYDNMLKIMRNNKNDPEKARAELEAYQNKYENDIARLSDQLENMSEEETMDVWMKFMAKAEELDRLVQEMTQ